MLMRINRFPVIQPLWTSSVDLEKELDQVFGDFTLPAFVSSGSRTPRVSLTESEAQSELIVELPGVNKEDLTISLENGLLTVTGERKPHGLPDGAHWIRSESVTGKFVRTVELPHAVDPQAIRAELKNGLLHVVLPKAEAVRPREISIR